MRNRAIIISLTILLTLTHCGNSGATSTAKSNQALQEQSKQFKKEVIQVTDKVHVAVGFGLANSILIEAPEGLIIVDTMETLEESRAVRVAFEKISKKKVKALIYTHNHVDHVMGAETWADSKPQVLCHDSTFYYLRRIANKMRPIITARSMRMFGTYLDERGLVNSGVGPRLGMNENSSVGTLAPTKTFATELKINLAGLDIELYHAPGESNDQLFVWIPAWKVLLPGDNFYHSFPNLYTIRGTPYRSVEDWARSLELMRSKKPEHLVPSHTQPVSGADKIDVALRDYRDAIQFVHDQSIRGINLGLTPDELVEFVTLPEHLAKSPYLQEFYGKVSWSVKSVFAGNLGWFDGNSANLQPLSLRKKAELFAKLAGGVSKLENHAKEALEKKEFQEALEITDQILRLQPANTRVKRVRIKILVALAEREINANARHYYLTEALEIEKDIVVKRQIKISSGSLRNLDMAGIFSALVVNLDPEKSAETDTKVGFEFTDSGETFTVHVRRGVAFVEPRLGKNLDIRVKLKAQVFKEMLARIRSPLTTPLGFTYQKGSSVSFLSFLSMFKPGEQKLPFLPLKD